MTSESETVDETARLRQAFAARSLDAVPAADCPPAERLWSAARSGAGVGDLRELIEHLAACGVCAEAWRLARELDPVAGGERRTAALPWWRQPVWTLAAAALVVLVFGLSWRQPAERPADTFRGASPEQVLRMPEDGGRLSRRDPLLRWQATAGATYDLAVMSEDFETLVEVFDLESAEYRISKAELRAVPAGAALYWQVEVKAAAGSFELPTYRFVLDP